MLKIAHRINTPEALAETPRDLGVEMDIHAFGTELVVHHDPFTQGVNFQEWLDAYDHRFVVLNVKEEGVEDLVLECMRERKIEDFFVLDLSLPAFVRVTGAGETRVAVRISEYEPVEAALLFEGRAQWAWIDSFRSFNLSDQGYEALKKAGFKLCLVSPELQRRSTDEVAAMRQHMSGKKIVMDAVCTKRPDLW